MESSFVEFVETDGVKQDRAVQGSGRIVAYLSISEDPVERRTQSYGRVCKTYEALIDSVINWKTSFSGSDEIYIF